MDVGKDDVSGSKVSHQGFHLLKLGLLQRAIRIRHDASNTSNTVYLQRLH